MYHINTPPPPAPYPFNNQFAWVWNFVGTFVKLIKGFLENWFAWLLDKASGAAAPSKGSRFTRTEQLQFAQVSLSHMEW